MKSISNGSSIRTILLMPIGLIFLILACDRSINDDELPKDDDKQKFTVESKDGNISVITDYEITEDILIETYYDSSLILFSIEPSITLKSQAEIVVALSTFKPHIEKYPARLLIYHFTEDSIYFQQTLMNKEDDSIQFNVSSFSNFAILLGTEDNEYSLEEGTTLILQILFNIIQNRIIAGDIDPWTCNIANFAFDMVGLLEIKNRPRNGDLFTFWHLNIGIDITNEAAFDYIRKEIIEQTIDAEIANRFDCKQNEGLIKNILIKGKDEYMTMVSHFDIELDGFYDLNYCNEGKAMVEFNLNVKAKDKIDFNRGDTFTYLGVEFKDDVVRVLQKECDVGTDFIIETPSYEYRTIVEVECDECLDQSEGLKFKLNGSGGGKITYSHSDGSIKRIIYNLDAAFDLVASNPKERTDNYDWIEYDVLVKNGSVSFTGVALDSLDAGHWDEYNFDRGVTFGDFAGSILLYSISQSKVFYVGFPLHVAPKQDMPTPYGMDFFGESDSLVAKIELPGKWRSFFGNDFPVPATIIPME